METDRVLNCGCKAVSVNGKWIYEEYCEEHDPENDSVCMEAFRKPLKKFRINQDYDI